METIIGLIFFVLLLAWASFLLAQFYNIVFQGFAPFFSTRPKVIKKIVDALEIRENAVVYELGCGRAGFLGAAGIKYPKAELIGVEGAFWPYVAGKIQNSLSRHKIKIIKKNIFNVNLEKADAIYLYLNAKTIHKLEEKIKKECCPGTQVISYHFPFPSREPAKVVPVDNGKELIYFYTQN